ncbi:Uncharacterized protein APZ42_013504 [Daphnia magna]|uniref:Uncharacterized protein n=1 Tax=Daphnia magna TaxID=35525 RepID=A0A162QTD2_9CRUS|nr:Uncharacterized protein APZ42_013504 [Daphnia magna]
MELKPSQSEKRGGQVLPYHRTSTAARKQKAAHGNKRLSKKKLKRISRNIGTTAICKQKNDRGPVART